MIKNVRSTLNSSALVGIYFKTIQNKNKKMQENPATQMIQKWKIRTHKLSVNRREVKREKEYGRHEK